MLDESSSWPQEKCVQYIFWESIFYGEKSLLDFIHLSNYFLMNAYNL